MLNAISQGWHPEQRVFLPPPPVFSQPGTPDFPHQMAGELYYRLRLAGAIYGTAEVNINADTHTLQERRTQAARTLHDVARMASDLIAYLNRRPPRAESPAA